MAINATPFLLPLMFQIGFHDDALTAGLMLLIYMGGNLAMKATTTRLLRRFGFRRVLVVNGMIGALTIAACGLFTPAWPLLATAAVLVAAGMSRSMQFTALNTIAFADIGEEARSGATTMAAMAQQVGSALGVACAALALASAQAWVPGPLALMDFRIAFAACGLLMAVSACWLQGLPRQAGAAAIATA